MKLIDALHCLGVIVTIGFVLFSVINIIDGLADNSTRKDWGGDEKGKYCPGLFIETWKYDNGTIKEKVTPVKMLCWKGA